MSNKPNACEQAKAIHPKPNKKIGNEVEPSGNK
jgi:hypothetical protein